ncbi:MAG: hypothetical protein V4625_03065 [Pseudomonadota bacterium]
MNQHSPHTAPRLSTCAIVLASASLLAACAGNGAFGPEAPLYLCEAGFEFRARFIDDSVVIDSSGSRDVLFRDAGGTGQQAFYGNARMKAEFGMGSSGREAIVRYPLLPLALRCVRQ